ncbi:MAG: LuxR C-terminal-related transcriptional regulator [Actinomycetota bacterium]
MDDSSDLLEEARRAFERRDWAAARDGFKAARERMELEADDFSALGDSAWWLGDVDEALSAYEAAYRLYLHGDQPRKAAFNALGLAVSLFLRGEVQIGSGWMSRAQRLLRDQPEGVEHGYLVYLDLENALAEGDLDAVIERASHVGEMGRRFGDGNLVAVAILFEGRALVRRGEMREGMALLDEAMVAVISDDLIPDWAGNIYCHLMAAFHELGDIRRAAEWVEATQHWLDTLPAAVLFTGICRVHRSQVLQVTGAWEQAEREALRVCEELADIHVVGAAEGHYQVGEMQRLRGDLSGAEASYQQAHERGRDPQPGLALLRLAQGRLDAASASIQVALVAETHNRLARAPLCAAQVEIALAAESTDSARRACEELVATAAVFASSGLQATALHCRGAVALAGGLPDQALPILRDACRRWRDLRAEYNASKVCVLLARAYAELGDADASQRELDAAATVFERLGAVQDAREVDALRDAKLHPDGLTAREAEVLALVATGMSNREVARSLTISEKTVARHISNIFAKLNVTSRTEAAGYAFSHRLTTPTTG